MRQMLIDGEWTDAASGKAFDDINPATGDVIDQVAEGDAEDIDRAVRAARKALDGPWSRMTGHERGRRLRKMCEIIDSRLDELAVMETRDVGKPIADSRGGDIPGTIVFLEYYASLADKIDGAVHPLSTPDTLCYTRHEPLGVIAAIVPWNFPMAAAAQKVGPALACGNTVVLKPAEESPLTALELGRIALEADVPPGVLNVVPGYGETAGAPLISHPGVDKISFTGSTEVGKLIMKSASQNLTEVMTELGGKMPNIVLADADFEVAVNAAIRTIFLNQGQICTAGSRLVVERSIHDRFVSEVVSRATQLRVGDPMDPKTQMGSLVSRVQFDRVTGYIELGNEEGATLLCGGKRPDDPALADGYFLLPTVFAQVENHMRIAQEEIFGPVLSVLSVKDFDEALAVANDTHYGLSAALFTTNINRAMAFVERAQATLCWVNCTNMAGPQVPYQGYKHSGVGVDGGTECLKAYTRTKSVVVDYSGRPVDWANPT